MGVSFEESDLTRAVFESTNLKKADFTNAHCFSIDPSKNQVEKAKFSKNNLAGLLRKYKLDINH